MTNEQLIYIVLAVIFGPAILNWLAGFYYRVASIPRILKLKRFMKVEDNEIAGFGLIVNGDIIREHKKPILFTKYTEAQEYASMRGFYNLNPLTQRTPDVKINWQKWNLKTNSVVMSEVRL